MRVKAFVGIIVDKTYNITMFDIFNASDLFCVLLVDGPPIIVITMGVKCHLLFCIHISVSSSILCVE